MMARLSCLLLLVLAGGCGQRVIDLALPPRDAAAAGTANGTPEAGMMEPVMMACEDVKRADGTVCKLCFAADGSVVNGACEPARPTTPSVMPPDTNWYCKPKTFEALRCLSCTGPGPSYDPCLRCEADMPSGKPGERCRTCGWSDLPGGACKQCLDGSDRVISDDCNQIRKEMIPAFPPP